MKADNPTDHDLIRALEYWATKFDEKDVGPLLWRVAARLRELTKDGSEQ